MIEQKRRLLGQSMIEYVIIVALIAVAGIAIYGLFGDTVRGQMGATNAELGGDAGTASNAEPNTTDASSSRSPTDLAKGTKQ